MCSLWGPQVRIGLNNLDQFGRVLRDQWSKWARAGGANAVSGGARHGAGGGHMACNHTGAGRAQPHLPEQGARGSVGGPRQTRAEAPVLPPPRAPGEASSATTQRRATPNALFW